MCGGPQRTVWHGESVLSGFKNIQEGFKKKMMIFYVPFHYVVRVFAIVSVCTCSAQVRGYNEGLYMHVS